MVLPTNLTPVGHFQTTSCDLSLCICYVHQTLEGWIDNNPLECKVMINHTQCKFQINNLTQKPSRIILWKGSLFIQPIFIQICSATIKKKQIYVCTYIGWSHFWQGHDFKQRCCPKNVSIGKGRNLQLYEIAYKGWSYVWVWPYNSSNDNIEDKSAFVNDSWI